MSNEITEGDRILRRDRQRRWRERRRAGIKIYPVALDPWMMKQLRYRGFIDDDTLRDHESMAEALGDALERLLGNNVRM